jgi:hypothetical protein
MVAQIVGSHRRWTPKVQGTGGFCPTLILVPRTMEEAAMCYSRAWEAEQERKRQEAKAREAHERRAEVINTLRTDAEKEAEKARKGAADAAPAK